MDQNIENRNARRKFDNRRKREAYGCNRGCARGRADAAIAQTCTVSRLFISRGGMVGRRTLGVPTGLSRRLVRMPRMRGISLRSDRNPAMHDTRV
jgi:hypothetical protein